MSLAPGGAAYEVVLDCHGTQVALDVGDGTWASSTFAVGGVELPVVASGGWDGDGCFSADAPPHRDPPHACACAPAPTGRCTSAGARCRCSGPTRSGAPCGDRPCPAQD